MLYPRRHSLPWTGPDAWRKTGWEGVEPREELERAALRRLSVVQEQFPEQTRRELAIHFGPTVGAADGRKVFLSTVSFAVAWHFVWDWIAFSSWSFGAIAFWQEGAAVVLMLTGLYVYGACVSSGLRRSRDHFAPEDSREIWGWPLNLFRR